MSKLIEKLQWFDVSGAWWPFWRLAWGFWAIGMIILLEILGLIPER